MGITSSLLEPFFVEINPVLNEIYISVFWSGSDDVIFINGATDSITTTIGHSSGSYTYGIGVNTNDNHLYVGTWGYIARMNGTDNSLIAGEVPGIATSEYYGIVVNPSTNRMYAANVDDDEILVVNTLTDTEVTSITVGIEPYGVCINTNTNQHPPRSRAPRYDAHFI